jgi:hypothetical protein
MSNETTRGSVWGKNVVMLGLGMLFALMATPALATPLDFNLKPYPDIFASGINFTYDTGYKTFEGDGFIDTYKYDAATYDHPVDLSSLQSYSFIIKGTLDSFFNLSSGFLQISGTRPDVTPGTDTPITLTGALTAMWHGAGVSPLTFQFDADGGNLLGEFSNGKGGVIISGFDFDGLISQDGLTADVGLVAAAVPEPGTVSLFLLGSAGLAFLRRRQMTRKSS